MRLATPPPQGRYDDKEVNVSGFMKEAEGMNDFAGSVQDYAKQVMGTPEPASEPASEPAPSIEEVPFGDQPDQDDPQYKEAAESEEDVQYEETGEEDTTDQEDPSEARTVEIKARRRTHKFNLDPEDKELQKTLSLGVAARKWQNERDEARNAIKQSQSQIKELSEKASVWDELQQIAEAGQDEQAVKLLLGEEGFEKFMQGRVQERMIEESGSPEEIAEVQRSRSEREKHWREEQARRQNEKLQRELDDIRDNTTKQNLRSMFTNELQRFDMNQFVEDADYAQELNESLYTLALSDLHKLAEKEQREPTVLETRRAFARRARVLRGGGEKITQAQQAKKTAAKAEKAKVQAQKASKARYNQPLGEDVMSKWDGKSMKSFMSTIGLRK